MVMEFKLNLNIISANYMSKHYETILMYVLLVDLLVDITIKAEIGKVKNRFI